MHRVRLGISVLLLIFSLPVIVPAANPTLWLLTIFVTEWGHWLAMLPIIFLAWEQFRGRGRWRLLTCLFCLIAACLYCLPLAESIPAAHALPIALTQAFGPEPVNAGAPEKPIEFRRLWGEKAPAARVANYHYKAVDGTSLPLDFYTSGAPGKLPCILVIHGGAWVTGNEKELSPFDVILTSLGCRVASIAYRLAPRYHWPAQKEDVIAALTYLKARAGTLGIDENQFILMGRSAGGQMALATGYAIHDPAIKGCIAEYPVTDMKFDYDMDPPRSILPMRQIITALLGAAPDAAAQLAEDASPVGLAGPDTPPTLLGHGARDEIVWIGNSRRLRDRLVQLHRPVYLLELPWATHGFDANTFGPGGQLNLYAIAWFLGSVLRR